MKISVQLYSLRDLTAKDFKGTVEKVAKLGYDGVEFAGYGGLNASEVKVLLNDTGLLPSGSHIGMDAFMGDNYKHTVEFIKEIGLTDAAIPWLEEKYRETEEECRKTGAIFEGIAQKLAADGITLSYHNHGFEFEKINGVYVMDLLLESAPSLKMQLDVCWCGVMGVSAVDFMNKWSDRMSSFHAKDYKIGETPLTKTVGAGEAPMSDIVEAGKKLNLKWTVVEQDEFSGDPIESVESSLRFLRSLI